MVLHGCPLKVDARKGENDSFFGSSYQIWRMWGRIFVQDWILNNFLGFKLSLDRSGTCWLSISCWFAMFVLWYWKKGVEFVFLDLLQPKWNNRIDNVGSSLFINCILNLYHHRLGPRNRLLILSSDGLYQYFTSEEAMSEVELFIQWSPEGDPAQHLIDIGFCPIFVI